MGARPGTQPMDMAHGCATVLEEGLDQRGVAAVGQLDLKTFYDTFPAVRCCLWLEEKGVDRALCAAEAQHQLAASVRVVAATGEATIAKRAWGTLTGSRTSAGGPLFGSVGASRLARLGCRRHGPLRRTPTTSTL